MNNSTKEGCDPMTYKEKLLLRNEKKATKLSKYCGDMNIPYMRNDFFEQHVKKDRDKLALRMIRLRDKVSEKLAKEILLEYGVSNPSFQEIDSVVKRFAYVAGHGQSYVKAR